VRNDPEGLRRTIESVSRFKGLRTEYVIVEGASDDNTLHVLDSYHGLVDRLLSEPDNGIYDAMNKGIALARGEYLHFLNAGDELLVDLESVLSSVKGKPVVIYGKSNRLLPDGSLSYVKGKRLRSAGGFLKGMPICHQATLYQRNVMPLYDLRFRLIADRVLNYQILLRHGIRQSVFVDRVIVNFYEGGFSASQHFTVSRAEEDLFYHTVNKPYYILYKRINRVFKDRIRMPLRRFFRGES
jgi:glycosyltransferase involved in cell wall biosynthesis